MFPTFTAVLLCCGHENVFHFLHVTFLNNGIAEELFNNSVFVNIFPLPFFLFFEGFVLKRAVMPVQNQKGGH